MTRPRLRPEIIRLPINRFQQRDYWLLRQALYMISAAALIAAFILGALIL